MTDIFLFAESILKLIRKKYFLKRGLAPIPIANFDCVW